MTNSDNLSKQSGIDGTELFFRGALSRAKTAQWLGCRSFLQDGKVIPWEIRVVSGEENERIYDAATNADGLLDTRAYLRKLVCASLTFPDLKSQVLQDEWGVMGEEALLLTLLTPGELNALTGFVLEHNGFSKREREAFDTAKK